MNNLVVLAILAFVTSACGMKQQTEGDKLSQESTVNSSGSIPENSSRSEATPGNSPKDAIRSASDKCGTDFGNFRYDWFPAEYSSLVKDKEITLVDGKGDVKQTSLEHLMFEASLENVSCVSIAGQSRKKAIVTVGVSFSNRAKPMRIFVFDVDNGIVKMLWKYDTGTDGRDLRGLSYEKNGMLVIEEYDNKFGNPTPAHCCPRRYFRTYFSNENNTFQKTKVETFSYAKDYREFLGYRNVNDTDNTP